MLITRKFTQKFWYKLIFNIYLDKSSLIEEIRRIIRSSVGNRAKESLIVDFINNTNLDSYDDRTDVIKAFYEYAQAELKKEATALIAGNNLNEKEAKHYP